MKYEKRKYNTYRYLFLSIIVLLSFQVQSQDSIPLIKDLTEDKELTFQKFFFKALTEKAINNHQKAIENLESCNQILTNNTAVYFEFSKNYLELNNTLLAKEYINRALVNEPRNIWMLKHLIKILVKDRAFSKAISVQQKLIEIDGVEREMLVKLYVWNKEYKKAISLMEMMGRDKALSTNLKKLKKRLENRGNKKSVVTQNEDHLDLLKKEFKSNKSYVVLKKILKASKNSPETRLKYAEEGISLYPLQAFLYLMKGQSLNSQKKHREALVCLKNGIDFVVDKITEIDFYKEMIISYKELGEFEEEKKLINKIKERK